MDWQTLLHGKMNLDLLYPPLQSFNMIAVSQKLNNSLKKQTQFSISFLQSKTPFELEVKFMLKCNHLGGKGGANNPPKEPQTGLARGGGQ